MSDIGGDDNGISISVDNGDGTTSTCTVCDDGTVNLVSGDGTEVTVVPGEFAEIISPSGDVSTYTDGDNGEAGTFTPDGSEANWY